MMHMRADKLHDLFITVWPPGSGLTCPHQLCMCFSFMRIIRFLIHADFVVLDR